MPLSNSSSFRAYAKNPIALPYADLLTLGRYKKLHQKLKSEEMKKASRLLCWLRATKPFRSLHVKHNLTFANLHFLTHEVVPIQRTIFASVRDIVKVIHEWCDATEQLVLIAALVVVSQTTNATMIVCLHIESELGEDADEIILLGTLLQLLGAGPGVEHFLRLSTAESLATCGRFGRFHKTAVEQVLTDRSESLGRDMEMVFDDRVKVTHVSVSLC
jgi:hypothetical protein